MTGESDDPDKSWVSKINSYIVMGWGMIVVGVIVGLGAVPVIAGGNYWFGFNITLVAMVLLFLGMNIALVGNIVSGDPNAE